MDIKIKKGFEDVILPEYKTVGSAAADIRAYLQNIKEDIKFIINKEYSYKRISSFYDEVLQKEVIESITLYPGERALIPTGLFLEIEPGYEGFILNRSGISFKEGLGVFPGTIDDDYRGEIFISVYNTSLHEAIVIKHQDRIAQIKFYKKLEINFIVTESLSNTDRGEGGFGHTGKQ